MRVCPRAGAEQDSRRISRAIRARLRGVGHRTVRARLVTFHRQTEPVIDYYRLINLLLTVPGHGAVDDVKRATLEAVRLRVKNV